MKNIFKIIEYLPDTQQIVVRYARKNTHKNIDEYIESAVDMKQLDLYSCETFSKSLMRKYGEHNIERVENDNFIIKILKEIKFPEETPIFEITKQLNEVLEKMIESNPDQWIWTHNRWKI